MLRSLARPPRDFARLVIPGAVALAMAAFAPSAHAEDSAMMEELRRLRAELDAERSARTAERAALEKRLAAVEGAGSRGSPVAATSDEIAAAVDRYLEARPSVPTAPPTLAIPGTDVHLDVALILDVSLGTSTATDAALADIELGDHDPRVRGANVRNEELILSARVDPYVSGFLAVIYKLDEAGESAFELEEAYALAASPPCGLEAKVGQFLTEFGRTNPVHPHAWEFLNQPVILGRVFGGDGWRGQGARLSWLVPRLPLRILAGFQNARGETQVAFLGEAGEEVGAHVSFDRDVANLSDLAWHARVEASHDFAGCGHGGAPSVLAGISGGWGPNATGPGARTNVYGADLALSWSRRSSHAERPVLEWMTEVVLRDHEADDQVQTLDDGMGGTIAVPVAARVYRDWGGYSQFVWGFHRAWTVGARVDYAASDGAFAGDHGRATGALTYYPSEHSRIRLQLHYDDVAGLGTVSPGDDDANWSVWLNFELTFGTHGDHDF